MPDHRRRFLDFNRLKEAIAGRDVVYANLSGDLEAMAKNIVRAMDETEITLLINSSSWKYTPDLSPQNYPLKSSLY